MLISHKNRRAFTLIEIMLVMTILVILIPLTAFSFSSARTRLVFEAEVAEAMAMFREARNSAIINRKETGNEVKYFRIEFKDQSQPPKLKLSAIDDQNNVIAGSEETMTFSKGTDMSFCVSAQIADPAPNCTSPILQIKIDFAPPYGDITINNGNYSSVSINLSHLVGSRAGFKINDVAGIPEWE